MPYRPYRAVCSQVVAIASCQRSSVEWMQSDAELTRDTRMVQAYVTVLDIDNLEINTTKPEGVVEIVSPSSYYKLQLMRPIAGGSAVFVEIPVGVRSELGSYVVRVWLSDAWDEPKQTRGPCMLFERTIVVGEPQLDIKLVILLSLLGVVLLTLSAVLTYLIYKNKAKATELLLSVAEFEGLLTVEMAAEVWNIAGGSFFMSTIFENKAKPMVYKLLWPYVVFFSLGSACSLVSIAIKALLFYGKFCARYTHTHRHARARAHTLPEVLCSILTPPPHAHTYLRCTLGAAAILSWSLQAPAE